ncbi:MAG: PTS sugar transporter subunit IIA [bacterium]
MRIMDYLCKGAVAVDLKSKDKKGVINELVDLMLKAKKISDKDKIIKILLEREELGSTGIGQGIAIPHGKTNQVDEVVVAFGSSKQGVDFEALDGESVFLVFLLLAPMESSGVHLKALAKISRLLKDKYFRQALRDAKNADEVIKVIKEENGY